jgi:hypothetical protein
MFNSSAVKQILVPLGLLTLLVVAWRNAGWSGIALVGGGLVMWGLLHVTRLVTVFRRASEHPKGWVDSGVMLHAQLKVGMGLLDVLARTRALGELVSPQGEQPEVYRWTDNGGVSVDCAFTKGRLSGWTMQRAPEPSALPAVATNEAETKPTNEASAPAAGS